MTHFKSHIATAVLVVAVAAIAAPVASGGIPVPRPIGGGPIVTVAPTGGTNVARHNDGRFRVSSEAIRKNNEQLCENLWDMFETSVNEAVKYDRAGNTSARNDQLAQATAAKNDARKQGCSWA